LEDRFALLAHDVALVNQERERLLHEVQIHPLEAIKHRHVHPTAAHEATIFATSSAEGAAHHRSHRSTRTTPRHRHLFPCRLAVIKKARG
jgi:hypothetical protein